MNLESCHFDDLATDAGVNGESVNGVVGKEETISNHITNGICFKLIFFSCEALPIESL